LHDQAEIFAHTMTLEMGKRISEARGEVELVRTFSLTTPRTPSVSWQQRNFIRKLVKHTWRAARSALLRRGTLEFPYYQLARVAGPHLMAGNVLVVKHAGCVPQCAIAFEELWIDAGAPQTF